MKMTKGEWLYFFGCMLLFQPLVWAFFALDMSHAKALLVTIVSYLLEIGVGVLMINYLNQDIKE